MSKLKSTFGKVPYSEFRSMANVLKTEFPKVIQRMHWERGENIGMDHAVEISKHVIKESRDNLKWWQECKEGKDPSDKYVKSQEQQIWVICEGDYVRGYHTQAKGAVAARNKGSYRSKLSHITARPREEFLHAIMGIIECDHIKAESIMETGRRNKFFKCVDR